MAALRSKLSRDLTRLRRDTHGVSAVEFAILVPLMLLLFIGGTQVTEAITIKRKITLVARTIGDLVTQDTSVTNAEMTAIFDAARAVAAPYPTTPLRVIVSSVSIDAAGVAKIAWSDSSPTGYARTANSTVTLPTGLNVANTTLIWAESSYTYTPVVAFTMFSSTNTGAYNLTDQIYMRPRQVNSIARVP